MRRRLKTPVNVEKSDPERQAARRPPPTTFLRVLAAFRAPSFFADVFARISPEDSGPSRALDRSRSCKPQLLAVQAARGRAQSTGGAGAAAPCYEIHEITMREDLKRGRLPVGVKQIQIG